jgi:hypothetical protein
MGKPSDEKLAAEVCYAARILLQGLAKFDGDDPEWGADIRKRLPGIEATLE